MIEFERREYVFNVLLEYSIITLEPIASVPLLGRCGTGHTITTEVEMRK